LCFAALSILATLAQIGWWSAFDLRFGDGDLATILATAAIVLVAFTFTGGYYILFEHLMRGQTPGKKAMRIRAIRDDGTAMLSTDILIRNLMRLVDFLPALYGLGAVVMFIHPQGKRLGDIAAGTIVVKEGHVDYRARQDKKYALETSLAGALNRELRPEHLRLLTGFLARREELLPDARKKLAEQLVQRLQGTYGGVLDDAERYLERLSEGRHYDLGESPRPADRAPSGVEAAGGAAEHDPAQGTAALRNGAGAGADPPVS
jgi:uncharacterized RDD family membrane protein YckC